MVYSTSNKGPVLSYFRVAIVTLVTHRSLLSISRICCRILFSWITPLTELWLFTIVSSYLIVSSFNELLNWIGEFFNYIPPLSANGLFVIPDQKKNFKKKVDFNSLTESNIFHMATFILWTPCNYCHHCIEHSEQLDPWKVWETMV